MKKLFFHSTIKCQNILIELRCKKSLIILFGLIFLCSCKLTKIKTVCLGNMNENRVSVENKILHQIDSVYNSTQNGKLKKLIGTRCINDTIIEIKVQNTLNIFDLFYFNNKLHLLDIKHELEVVY